MLLCQVPSEHWACVTSFRLHEDLGDRVPKQASVPRCGNWGWEEPGVSGSPHPHDLTYSLAADRTGLFPPLSSSPHLHPDVGCPAFIKPTFGSFLPSNRLGNGKSLESCSSRCKLNYIHQPGASTIVPRAFPALIRIFVFSLGKGGQPISTSITLPGARTWNRGAHWPSDGAASRREGGGLWRWVCPGGPSAFFLPPSASWCVAKTGKEGTQQEMSLERTHARSHTHTHTHTQPWGTRESFH